MPSPSPTSKHAATSRHDARPALAPSPRRFPRIVALGAAWVLGTAIALGSGASAHAAGEASKEAPMTPEAARAAVDRMAQRSEELFRRYREAKQGRDVIRARCLDQFVSMAHAVERRGEDEADAISRAARIPDEAALAARSHRLRILMRNSEALKDASDSCV